MIAIYADARSLRAGLLRATLLVASFAASLAHADAPEPAQPSRQILHLRLHYHFPSTLLPGVRTPVEPVGEWHLSGEWTEAEIATFLELQTNTSPPFVDAQLRSVARGLRKRSTLTARCADALRGSGADTPEWRVADGVVRTTIGENVVEVRPYLAIERTEGE